MGDLQTATVKQALMEAQEHHEATCRVLADQRDAAQARSGGNGTGEGRTIARRRNP